MLPNTRRYSHKVPKVSKWKTVKAALTRLYFTPCVSHRFIMWNQKRYEEVKAKCKADITSKCKSPYDYMFEYKKMVEIEDYEACKAITEVLSPLNYKTEDAHVYIASLNCD